MSVVGLGGYELGPEPGEHLDRDRAASVIRTALESGVDRLDTSENYLDTQNESLIGSRLVWGAPCTAVVEGLRAIGDRLDATVAQLAIGWVLAQPGVSAAIVGSRDGRHMRQNAAASDRDLTEVLDELERLLPLGPNVAGGGGSENVPSSSD